LKRACESFADYSYTCYQCAGSSKYRNLAEEILKVGHAQISAQVFRFFELASSTDNFNPDCLVGEGGFGRVYKGYIESIEKVFLSLSLYKYIYAHQTYVISCSDLLYSGCGCQATRQERIARK
jgi:hypothetical protein